MSYGLRRLYRMVDDELRAWGLWMTMYHGVAGGYSRSSSWVMITEGTGGGVPCSRPPILSGAPERIQTIYRKICRLAPNHQEAVFLMNVGTHNVEAELVEFPKRCREANRDPDKVATDYSVAREYLMIMLAEGVASQPAFLVPAIVVVSQFETEALISNAS